MDPVTGGLMAASTAASLAGLFSGNDAQENIEKAVQQLIQLKVPDPAQQRLELERYRSAGELSPELERAIKEDPSAFEHVVKNVKYSTAQDRALQQLQSLGEEGGLSLGDKADIQQQTIANATKDRGNREAIVDEMARRGQGGSGMALQAQLEGAQSAGDRDAMMRMQTLGGAQARALQAIEGAGDLAGKLNQQDYQRQSDLAQARDRISQFNTQNAQSVQQRNVAANNAAQAMNLENQQKLFNANTDMGNKEQQYNKELLQKQFDNQLSKAGSVANAYTGAANQANQAAAHQSQVLGAIGSGLGQAGAAYQNQSNWDSWLKKMKGTPTAGGSLDTGVYA